MSNIKVTSTIQEVDKSKMTWRQRIAFSIYPFAYLQGSSGSGSAALDVSGRSRRNPASLCGSFTFYLSQIFEVRNRYLSTELYGSGFIKTTVDARTQFICGNGVNASVDDGLTRETEWLEAFIEENELKGSGLSEIVRLAEMEGRCLVVLIYRDDGKHQPKSRIRVAPVSYWRRLYVFEKVDLVEIEPTSVIVTSVELGTFYAHTGVADNLIHPPTSIQGIKDFTRDKGSFEEKTYEENDFAFLRQYGLKDDLYVTPPPAIYTLYSAEAADRALDDWRSNNHLVGNPIPYVKVNTAGDVQPVTTIMGGKEGRLQLQENERIMRVLPGEIKYANPEASFYNTFNDEIVRNVQIVSGHAGVPVFMYGFPDVFGTKAGIEEIASTITQMTERERENTTIFIKELIKKAARKYSKVTGKMLDMSSLTVTLPPTSHEQMAALVSTWLPLQEAGIISERSLRERTPAVDPDIEETRIQEEKDRNISNFMGGMNGKDSEDTSSEDG